MRKWIWFLKHKIFIASGVVLEISSMAAHLLQIALDICKGLYSHILANNEASLLINSQKCMLLSQRLLETQETLQTVRHKLEMTGPQSQSTLMDVLLPMQELVHVLLKAQKTVIKDCSADCDRTLCETEINTLLTAAKKDEEDLQDLLRDLQAAHVCSVWGCGRESTCMQYLASQLLKQLKFQSEFQAWPAKQKKNYHELLYESKLTI
jgi:hypothetical protein